MVSKILERLVARQVVDYTQVKDLLPDQQSAYRRNYSTETAILGVLTDVLQAVDEGDVAALVLLDLSAAFDTVDHDILLQRLQVSYGFRGSVLNWFRSYLCRRQQTVRRGRCMSTSKVLLCGVPQGSVLGPILFVLYTVDLVRLIEHHGLRPHLYADDTQVYGRCSPASMDSFAERVAACTDDVSSWMQSNRLQLNADKTEFMWCATAKRLRQLPATTIRIGSDHILPSSSVRDLGVYIDADLSMRTHVQRTVASCFAVLRQLRSVRRSLSPTVLRTLVVSLVLTRLDYGNATLAGIPAYQLRRLQAVMNAAARFVANLPRSAHVTATLADLHWLRVAERIQFKLATLTYRCLHGAAPRYLSVHFRHIADIPSRRRLRSSASNALDVRRTRLATIGDRAFPVTAARTWNNLPGELTAAQSLSAFRRQLKTFLFQRSFPA